MLKLLQDLFNIVKHNFKAVILGAAFTLTTLWGIAQLYGVTWAEFTQFVLERKDQQDLLAKQLQEINDKVDEAEKISHSNHTKVLEIVQELGGSETNFKKILQMSAKNQDIIRALMEFGRIYATLVESGSHSQNTHQQLSALYQAVMEISADDPLDRGAPLNNPDTRKRARETGRSVCKEVSGPDRPSLCVAKQRLESISNEINDFPKVVRHDAEIEVLRYLSYAAARALEMRNSLSYTRRAENIYKMKKANNDIDSKLYRRKYFWIDYSRLVNLIHQGDDNYQSESWRYFNSLRDNLAGQDNFLLMKLHQHSDFITDDRKKEFWRSLMVAAQP